jgi:hypothetical protein
MAGIENIVVHSKVGAYCRAHYRDLHTAVADSAPPVLPRSLDPGPRAAFDLMERPAA